MKSIDEIRPGVAIVIFDEENNVLLQKRADVGLWGILSGHVEPGETVTAAAVREVLEETGLHIKVTRLIGVYSDPKSQIISYPDGRIVHFVTIYFLAKVIGGELSCNSAETLDISYFPVNDLPSDILEMHPNWLVDALSSNEGSFIR
ncbi:MAG: NUDIX domain-containing protein [Firmicutes bacterium]|nr:NUDIX domain-containing protein [Bacillota bacterium]